MIFTKEDKELILSQYLAWVDEVCDDLGDKNYFYPEEIVEKVLQLVENKVSKDDKLRERASWKKTVEESGEVVFVVG